MEGAGHVQGGSPVHDDGDHGVPVAVKVLRLTCFAGESKASTWTQNDFKVTEKGTKGSTTMAKLGSASSVADDGENGSGEHSGGRLLLGSIPRAS